MKITITHEELDKAYNRYYRKGEKYQTGVSGYVDIAESLGVCVGVGAMGDAYWYMDGINDAQDYTRKNYNFEADILKMSDKAFNNLLSELDQDAYPYENDGKHTAAATMALQNKELFADLIEACRDYSNDDAVQFIFKDYAAELQKSGDDAADDMRRDFIKGDYHGNFNGINREVAKLLDADSAVITDNGGGITITYEDDEQVKELMHDHYGRRDARMLKGWAIDRLVSKAKAYKDDQKVENEKRREERAKLEEYRAKQQMEKDEERRAMLDAIRLKKPKTKKHERK